MEAKKSSYQRVLQIIFTVMFYYLSSNPVHSQTWTPLAKGNASNASLIIQYDNAFNHRIGIGINGTTPTATFHLLGGTTITATPLFKVESPNNGYINYLYNDGSKSYGIYQTGTNLFNYLEGPIVSGLSFLGASSGITMISSNPFPFNFQISPTGAITTTMEVYNKKLKVIDTLECNNFRLYDNKGSGRILVGDDFGNGIWTDASTLNDNDWLVESVHGSGGNFQNLYANPDYQNVGIGTTSPKSKLHVMDGNILISRSPTKAPGSKNGSILFGEVVTTDWPLGEWGIEYYTGENGDTSKGLNFWKVATANNSGTNYCLYLNNNGNVGIGSPNPTQKFEVSHDDSTGGIAINQTSDNYKKSEIKFNWKTEEQWAIGSYLKEDRPRSFFIWNHLLYKTALFISEENNIGIDTEWPAAKLDVNGDLHVKDRVGIGTTNPTQMLEVTHSDTTGGITINQISMDTSLNSSVIRFARSGVEKFSIGYTVNYKRPAFFIWNHIKYRTALFVDDDNLIGIDTEWPAAKLDVNGDLHVNDKVGIGCVAPVSGNYKLFVEGGIKARELKITIHDFADYCFEKDYELMSIPDLEKFIKLNKHLPEIPTAKEIEENDGLEIGEMQTKLVKKIEEQTLYIIDLHKQVDELRKQVELLTKK